MSKYISQSLLKKVKLSDKMSKSSHSKVLDALILDLHSVNFKGENTENKLTRILDQFIAPLICDGKYSNNTITIIVGRGLNSTRLINGLPVLRYYTIKYLTMLGFKPEYDTNSGKVTFVNIV